MEQSGTAAAEAAQHAALHERARRHGVNRFVYRIVRGVLVPFFKLYFRLDCIGVEHFPAEGAAIIAANHRSFLDPFVIGACAPRPLYFVAKKELFGRPWQAWILNSLGAFPVDRGRGDEQTIETAKAILARGDVVLIFPEGTRIRPGTLGKPKRGVGRLALEAGVPVIPVAITGTEAVRRGWRIRPHKVRVRAGRALQFPQMERASPQVAAAVTDRIWPCVALQWEWLGGLAPIRRACVIGAGHVGTALAVRLAHAGYDVDLVCRSAEQARRLAETRVNRDALPEVPLPGQINIVATATLDAYGHDLICLAVAAEALPEVMRVHARLISARAGVLVLATGTVPGAGTPMRFVAEQTRARAVATMQVAGGELRSGAEVSVASPDRGFARQIADMFNDLDMAVSIQPDVAALEAELAGRTHRSAAA